MGNDIRLATNSVNGFRLGSRLVSKVYLGAAQVWPAAQDNNGEHWVSVLVDGFESYGSGVAFDATGNIYVCGSAVSEEDGYSDVFVAKYSSTGIPQWQRLINATDVPYPDRDHAEKIFVDASENIYIVGYSYLQDISSGSFISGQSFQVLIAKLDNNGNLQWQRRLGLAGRNCDGADIAVDSAGNVYITGAIRPWQADPAGKMLVAKYDGNGTLQWQKQLSKGGTGNYAGTGIAIDSSGDILVTGYGELDSYGYIYTTTTALIKCSANGVIQWAREITCSGAYSSTVGYAVATDAANNIYVAGYLYCEDADGTGCWVSKFNSSGIAQWHNLLSGDDSFYDVVVDAQGFVYATGYQSNEEYVSDIYVVKMSPTGSTLWQRSLGTGGSSDSYSIAVDNNGSLCIAGYKPGEVSDYNLLVAKLPTDGSLIGVYEGFTYQSVALQETAVSPVSSDATLLDRAPLVASEATQLVSGPLNLEDAAIALPDSAGSLASALIGSWTSGSGSSYWIGTLDTPSVGTISAIAINSAGDIYIAGSASRSSIDVDYIPFIAKYSNAGSLQWQRTLDGMYFGEYTGMCVDHSGNVYATGNYSPTTLVNGENSFSALLVKYNSNGAVQWQKRLGSSTVVTEPSSKVAADGSGNVYIIGAAGRGSASRKLMLAKYNSSGTLLWQQYLQGTDSEYGYGIAVSNTGQIYVTGFTYSGYYSGRENVLLAKYDSNGTLQWQQCLLGGAPADAGRAIAVDSYGNCYVTGTCGSYQYGYGTLFIARYDTNGVLQWQRFLDSNASSIFAVPVGRGISLDGDGNIYVTACRLVVGAGLSATLIAKYSPNGDLQWQRAIGPVAGFSDNALRGSRDSAIAVDAAGSLYLGTDFALPPSQDYYFMVAKLPLDGSGTGTYGGISYRASNLKDLPAIPETASTALTNTVGNIDSIQTVLE